MIHSKGTINMSNGSVFEKSEVTTYSESRLPQLGNAALAITGAIGTVAFGTKVASEFLSNDIDLNTVGLATLSATGLYVGATGFSDRIKSKFEKVFSRRATAVIGTVAGVSLLTIAAISEGGNEASVTVDQPEVNTEINVEDNTGINSGEQEIVQPAESSWPCEIYAPVQSNNGSPENIGSVTALQLFYVDEVGFPSELVNGFADDVTSYYTDLYQEEMGIDVSLPWGPETCSVSPFGDKDPSTPATGGWQAGWDYYLENAAPTE